MVIHKRTRLTPIQRQEINQALSNSSHTNQEDSLSNQSNLFD
jgi:hypothetical protein